VSTEKKPQANSHGSLRRALLGDCADGTCRHCHGPALDFDDEYGRRTYSTTRLRERCQFLANISYERDEPECAE
jgi:hypothetical protein